MKHRLWVMALLLCGACTTASLPVSEAFRNEATSLPVKGLQGWQVNQKLSFGPYSTSKIRRGWDFSASLQYTSLGIRPEEMLLRVFDIHTEQGRNFQRNHFQYTVGEGALQTEVYATEKFRENQLVFKSNNPWIGKASATNRYEYAFTAAIVRLDTPQAAPWSLVLVNRYDVRRDTARGPFDRPYVEEEGYATNGTDNIAIRPLRVKEVATGNGRNTGVLGGPMLAGYELQRDGKVLAMIDILDNRIWMHQSLLPGQKLIVASVASAMLLKRMRDVQQDRDALEP